MKNLMRWIGIALVVALLSAHTFTATSISRSVDEDLLHSRLRNLHIHGKNIHLILSTISDQNKIPIGLEVSLVDNLAMSKNITIDINDDTLEDVLNSIISQYPIYSWEIRDHVVNVFPKEPHRDFVLKKVLDTKLDSISIQKETRRLTLREMLCKNENVMKILDANAITPANESFTARDFGNVGRDFSFEASNVSVAAVLNRVIRDSQTKYWIIFRDGDRKQYLVLNI